MLGPWKLPARKPIVTHGNRMQSGPMDVIRTAVSMLGLYDKNPKDESAAANYDRAVSITAKIGVIAAYFHRARKGLELPAVRTDLG